ncbi:hypothetical protein RIF29_17264 [Crotalaria pallida]|uniref:Uncharacterized protein n=1 Tax=Crotalaria pallida TaxID=3830 RepID=A0AAN9IKC0_CROPI
MNADALSFLVSGKLNNGKESWLSFVNISLQDNVVGRNCNGWVECRKLKPCPWFSNQCDLTHERMESGNRVRNLYPAY